MTALAEDRHPPPPRTWFWARSADPRRRLVVIGNGMAGARTVEEILARGGAEQFAVTMFGDEPYGNYNRIMLSHVLSGDESDAGHLPQHPGLVRGERHHAARRRARHSDRPVRQARLCGAADGS